ncbi:methylated-DNA--[protein]-cysteine S-methyltransferase [Myceligenerans indicum]|uniref:Methylated-DNA--[protein]-cysteine S-methyltransferase n=1 Tax=Myceligenerans indicum TaxID=2593663 RepID=A0ABS1LM41_9MICO|nr:methylated-DNA--[protein]-cysteine S-methyltransferase [Myceligenerans indicum]MBL0887294.1 methylated-DNA--[protein]-cysteine S-methyltransferase [Myceligenerans indicum]
MHVITIDTPDGPFTIIGSEAPPSPDGGGAAVLASGWTDDAASLVALIHRSLRPSDADPRPPSSATVLDDAVEAVVAYYDGDHHAPARVPVRQASGEYRTHAWEVLRDVAPGERLTYAQYAERTGRPAAVRAAAGACALNAAALFVPCHRVLRTDGTLGGFRYGLETKERLLRREASAFTL